MKGTSEVGWASALAVPGTNSAIRDSGSLHVSALSSLGWVPPCSCTMAASGSTEYMLLVDLLDKRDQPPIAQ